MGAELNRISGNKLKRAATGLFLVAAGVSAWVAGGVVHAGSSVQCCKSVAPEFPPATTYGSTMARIDDPRSNYQPYQAIPIDAVAPPEVLLQQLWLTEGQTGPYSSDLVPGLRNLGAAYFADGQFSDAIDSFGRAIHLLRVNDGLYTRAQTGMVEQIIEAHIEMGNYIAPFRERMEVQIRTREMHLTAEDGIAADDQHEYLFRIRRENLSPIDPEMPRLVEQYADWHRTAYLGQLDRVRYPRIVALFDLYMEMADAAEEEKGGPSRAMLPYLEGKLR